MINDLRDSYRILDVEFGAPSEDVKRAYRELVRVWHPDRFAHDPALQRKALEKLKQINLAYERICEGEEEELRSRTSSAQSNSTGATENTRSSESDASSSSGDGLQQRARRQSPSQQPPQTSLARRLVPFAFTVVLLTILKVAFSTNEHTKSGSVDYLARHSQPVTGNKLTGTVIGKFFAPLKEQQASFGGRHIEDAKEIAGEYVLKVRVEDEKRTYEVPVESPVYDSKKQSATR